MQGVQLGVGTSAILAFLLKITVLTSREKGKLQILSIIIFENQHTAQLQIRGNPKPAFFMESGGTSAYLKHAVCATPVKYKGGTLHKLECAVFVKPDLTSHHRKRHL